MTLKRILSVLPIVALLLAAGCSGSDDDAADESELATNTEAAGIRLVTAEQGAAIAADPPESLVVLDVRTPEEFAEGHLEGAVMIDFYRDDFADQLAQLDPEASYLLYCRSGNRSGQTTEIMEQLGFADVADIDGGIVGWTGAGLPVMN